MKQNLYVLLGILLVMCIQSCSHPENTPTQSIHQLVKQDIDSLNWLIEQRLLPLAQQSQSRYSLQEAFLDGRRQYKKIEHFAEYFMPATTRLVNGPPLEEMEVEENKIFEPGGFQVIEEHLFPEFDTTQRRQLIREVMKLRREVKRLAMLWDETILTDSHVCDAIRLQAFRIITLGISGFDAPVSKNTMEESAISLATVQQQLKYYPPTSQNPSYRQLQSLLTQAIAYLNQHRNFDSFDRMHFITTLVNPLTTQLWNWQTEQQIPFVSDIRPLRPDVKTLFDEQAFDPDFYTNFPTEHTTPEKVGLGQRLFFDPILSDNNQRSCASCHQPDKAFTDGLPKSENIHRTGFVKRNTPTLINAALQRGQFYDFRTATLESQTQDVIESRDEMHSTMQEACQKLQKNARYLAMFKQAFPQMKDSIQPTHIKNALGSYERSLVAFRSRFDQYVRGDRTQMNAQEIKGFNLFMGKAKCGACHFMPLFNGTVPPHFIKTESEVIGVPLASNSKQIDPDMGRYAINPLEPWKYAFKTTTVRNSSLTAPYMHNGIYQTLDEVVDFYNKGGGVGLGMNLANQTLPFDQLHLNDSEKKALVAFMQTLTDVPASPSPSLALKSPSGSY